MDYIKIAAIAVTVVTGLIIFPVMTDTIILNEIGAGNEPTGRKIKKKIGYILRNCPEYGLFQGYCILSLLEV